VFCSGRENDYTYVWLLLHLPLLSNKLLTKPFVANNNSKKYRKSKKSSRKAKNIARRRKLAIAQQELPIHGKALCKKAAS
jgi:hypothetical protein